MPRSHPGLSLSLLLGLGACAIAPRSDTQPFATDCTLSAPIAAAVAAGALRQGLPFADPRPLCPPVVQQHDGEHFTIAYGRAASGGHWPLGQHRLGLQLGAVDAEGVPTLRPCRQTRDDGNAPIGAETVRLQLTIAGGPTGCRVRGELPPRLLQAVQQALRLAEQPELAGAGLDEPNLQRLVVHRLCALAAASDSSERAHELRCRAASTGLAPADLQQRLGDEAAASGDHDDARTRYWHALAMTTDPTHRALLSRRLVAVQARDEHPALWHQAARERMSAGDLETSARLLHSARRNHGDPIAGYRLTSLLHRQQGDPMAALANALLAREHAGGGGELSAYAERLWRDETRLGNELARSGLAVGGDWLLAMRQLVPALAAPMR